MSGKRTGSSLKYALIERERKFLMAPDPDMISGLPFKIVTDNYVEHTYLRIRKMTDKSGSIFKLTKKSPTGSFDKSEITTIYLTGGEYALLNIFGSVLIEKNRYIKEINGIRIVIDNYVKGNEELWLAEIEFDSDEQMRSFNMPINYIKEVTNDTNFNGYHLAKRFGAKTR